MSLTTDNVRPAPLANAWQVGDLTIAGVVMGIGELIFCTAVLIFGIHWMGFDTRTLQTLTFITIVFGNQATTYNNRGRPRLWSSRPSAWLIASSVADILIAATLAIAGIAMVPLPVPMVAGTLAAAVVFTVLLDLVKVPVFRYCNII
jgi:H+-transporting ATPase